MPDTVFDSIVSGVIPAHKIWEDDHYLAFLTPFPNTPGVSVVIPKANPGDYVFSLSDDAYWGLMEATRKVAKLLEKAFDTPRVALAFEGTGVAYVHAKLYPLHGQLASETGIWSRHTEFYPEYAGYFTTVEGPPMDSRELDKIQAQIVSAGQA